MGNYRVELGRMELAHIVLSIAAFGVFGLASLQALLMALQEYFLKKHPLKALTFLPPLEVMERILVCLINFGFILLSSVLASGLLFLPSLIKLLFAALCWLFFLTLIIGRYRYGWRGQTLMRWTLTGFLLMITAYLVHHCLKLVAL